ncbi:ABC transporter permease [Flavobacteriales bacterium]|nr:ABC transporter permease [Flavobacteriales bacterium]
MSNNKTGLIIKREYLTRVKKKSFILMTVFAPFLFAGFFALIIFLAMPKEKDYKVLVVDETTIMYEGMDLLQKENRAKKIKDNKALGEDKNIVEKNKIDLFESTGTYSEAIKRFQKENSDFDFLVYLPPSLVDQSDGKANLIYKSAPNSTTETKINRLINGAREALLMEIEKVDKVKFDRIKTKVGLTPLASSNMDELGNPIEDKAGFKIAAGVGFGFSILILMFILTFGMQVMRGVIEEKTSRIIEVIISSVKPFQIMMGKIVGIGLVGLTQFIFWIILTGILISIMTVVIGVNLSPDAVSEMSATDLTAAAGSEANEMISAIINLPWLALISSFLVYFLGGYFLYSALYAAIGAAVDSETDTQQFMIPVMLPLMLGLYVTQLSVFTNPEGSAMFWLSMIPFTSPIAMLVRIAMGNAEVWEVLLSIALLILTFIGTTWLGARIYKVGILMYGKKVTYKELFKWVRYKN